MVAWAGSAEASAGSVFMVGVLSTHPGARRSSVTPGIHTTPGSLERIHRPFKPPGLSGETRTRRLAINKISM